MRRRTRSEIVDSLPSGLLGTLGRALEFRIGQENAISKVDLIDILAQHGIHLSDDRPIRAGVHELRQMGVLICSSSGSSGYWTSESREEIDLFINSELRPRATDLFSTISALEDAASKKFGPRRVPVGQQPLFPVGIE